MKFWQGGRITAMTGNNIFVFGSNPEGRHGKGAAKAAMAFGATYKRGRGLSGNTYALVTKNLRAGFYERATGIVYRRAGNQSVSREQIEANIREMYQCARENPHLKFFVTHQATSRNLNGYSPKDMFDMFTHVDMPDNIRLHNSFRQFL